jgi:cation diffusion facilitator family transporter
MEPEKGADIEKQGAETKQIQRVALYGLLLNLGLTVMKTVLAFVSGSLAITASTIDSATDTFASLVLVIGLKLSTRKTSAFPLGLYKIENLLSVAVAFFIFFAGYEIARHAFAPATPPPDVSLTAILLIFVGTAAGILFGRYAVAVGRRTESPTLIAEGRHRQVDALSSIVVLAALFISYFQLDMDVYGITVDQIGAALVLLFIAHTGWKLLSDGMRVLLDASIDHETLAKVRKIIEAEPMVASVESLVGRNAGRFRFLQATITVRTDDLEKAHKTSKNIDENIRSRVPNVERVVIHYEPQAREYRRIALALSDSRGKLSSHFGESPYFALVLLRLRDYHIEKQEILENPYRDQERGKGIGVAEWLVAKGVDEVAVVGELKHKGPGYVFSDAGIKVYKVKAKDKEEAIASITAPGSSSSLQNKKADQSKKE